jgi:penicillin-binding protein 1A
MVARREGPYHYIVLTSAAVAAAVLSFVVYRYSHQIDLMAAQFQLETGPQASLLYDRHGQLMFSLHEEERIVRHLDQLSPPIVPAVLSAEDQHFRSHRGVDMVRMAGAAWYDVKSRHLSQGRAPSRNSSYARRRSVGNEPGRESGVKFCWRCESSGDSRRMKFSRHI